MSTAPARRVRRTARVILLDRAGHVLLFRYVAPGFAPFWILPGGACDADEDFAQAAARELHEETGISALPADTGITRESEYDYLGERVRSEERFFSHVAQSRLIDTSGHTALEREVMRRHRWFMAEELAGWDETFYPADLAALMRRFAPAAL